MRVLSIHILVCKANLLIFKFTPTIGYSSECSMNQILKKDIVTMLLITKHLMYNLDVLMGIFSPLLLYIRGQPSYKSHQTIKPSKVGFDKHLRMAFYDLRNERITCGNKVSVFWKVLFFLV